MFKPGTRIEMTKGYRGVKGVIIEVTESSYELYLVKLDNGINMAAGPSSFITLVEKE
jgi:hypothetical protein